MKLKFIRVECEIDITPHVVSTLEVHDHVLFTRMVRSLLSGSGKYSEEPYLIYTNEGKDIRPQNALLIANSLPTLPFNDRTLLNKLYRRVVEQVEKDSGLFTRIQDLASHFEAELLEATDALWGDYHLDSEWSLDAYLKAYKFSPAGIGESSFLDNCISFIDFCVDVAPNTPVVFINLKSFLAENEFQELVDHAFFSNFPLVLLESWKSRTIAEHERKTVLDQHFVVFEDYSQSE